MQIVMTQNEYQDSIQLFKLIDHYYDYYHWCHNAGLVLAGRDTPPIGQPLDLSLDAAADTVKVVLDATVS